MSTDLNRIQLLTAALRCLRNHSKVIQTLLGQFSMDSWTADKSHLDNQILHSSRYTKWWIYVSPISLNDRSASSLPSFLLLFLTAIYIQFSRVQKSRPYLYGIFNSHLHKCHGISLGGKKCRSWFLCQLIKLLYSSFNYIFLAMYLYGYLTVTRQMTDTDKILQSTQAVTTTWKDMTEEVVWKRLGLSQGPNRLPLLPQMRLLWITNSLATQIQCATALWFEQVLPFSIRYLIPERYQILSSACKMLSHLWGIIDQQYSRC